MTSDHSDSLGPDYDDTELDALLDDAMSDILIKLEAGFDPKAGLADIQARRLRLRRASQSDASAVPKRPATVPTAGGSSLQAVCDKIDVLKAYLTAAVNAARTDPFGGAAFLDTALPILMQLRSGLANRNLARHAAERLLDQIQHNLNQADRILRTQQHAPLDDFLDDRIGRQAEFGGSVSSQMRVLREIVIRLFDDSDDTADLVPVF